MKILLINPNTSVHMSQHIQQQAQQYCLPENYLIATQAAFGGEVIASRSSFCIAGHAAMQAAANDKSNAERIVLCCFGDPGLEAIREFSSRPVLGLLEASLISAAYFDQSFAVITAGKPWQVMLEERINNSEQAHLSAGVFVLEGMTGLDITKNPELFVKQLQTCVDQAENSGAKTVILGGSALAGFGARLHTNVRFIDPMQAAMDLIQKPDCPISATPAKNRINFSNIDQKLAQALTHND